MMSAAINRGDPKTSYAIAALVDGEKGAFPRVVQLTLERALVIWLGHVLAERMGMRTRLGVATVISASMSTWITVDYWLHANGYGGLFVYSS